MAAAMVSLPVSQPEATDRQDDPDDPVVAVLVPLSGELESMGRQLLEAAEYAVADSGVRVEGVDEGESGAQTAEAVQTLAGREEVAAVIGPTMRRHAATAADHAGRAGLPMLSYSSKPGVEQDSGWVMRARVCTGQQSEALARYLAEELKAQRIGLLAPQSGYGDDITAAVIDAFGELDGRVTALSRYQEETTDFRHPLEVLVGSRAYVGADRRLDQMRSDRWHTVPLAREGQVEFDALVIADAHHRVARLLPFLGGVGIATAADDQGERVTLLGLSGWKGDGLERAGDYARGAIFFDTFGGEVDGQTARQFVVDFREQTGREATTPEAELFDLVSMVAEATEAAAGDESLRDGVVRQLRSESYSGVSGQWAFDEAGAPVRTLHPYQVVDAGRWVRVAPRSH